MLVRALAGARRTDGRRAGELVQGRDLGLQTGRPNDPEGGWHNSDMKEDGMRTVLTFHRGEPATILEQSGIDELDMDPPGTERMTLGQWVDEIMERRREAAPCKR
jgi:hypothetical protein